MSLGALEVADGRRQQGPPPESLRTDRQTRWASITTVVAVGRAHQAGTGHQDGVGAFVCFPVMGDPPKSPSEGAWGDRCLRRPLSTDG